MMEIILDDHQKDVIHSDPFFNYLLSIISFTLQVCLCKLEMILDDPFKRCDS
jgi:hypothetical protein